MTTTTPRRAAGLQLVTGVVFRDREVSCNILGLWSGSCMLQTHAHTEIRSTLTRVQRQPITAHTMDNFEERSGVVPCKTPWGSWAQTIDEVVIEVDVPNGTQSREIKCDIRPNSILLVVNRETLLKVLSSPLPSSPLLSRLPPSIESRGSCLGLSLQTNVYGH